MSIVNVRHGSVVNTWDQCVAFGGFRVFITYSARQPAQPARWSVVAIKNEREVKTDPDAPWYCYGRKDFLVLGRDDRAEKLEEAKAWVKQKYGVSDFVRNRALDYVERAVNEKFPIPKRDT